MSAEDLVERRRQVIMKAVEVLGGESKAAAWLQTPKMALKGQTPLVVLDTEDGCTQVERLLADVWT